MQKIIQARFEEHLAVANAVMQSDILVQIERVASAIKIALANGKKVLFCGTPCQVTALKRAAHGREGLYTAELICHGVPSAELFKKYLSVFTLINPQIHKFTDNFRIHSQFFQFLHLLKMYLLKNVLTYLLPIPFIEKGIPSTMTARMVFL